MGELTQYPARSGVPGPKGDPGPEGPPGPVEDIYFQDIIAWSGSQSIPANSWFNFFALAGISIQPGGTAGTVIDSVADVIKLLAADEYNQIIFSTRINGTISGPSGTSREWFVQTRRPDGTTILGSMSTVKVGGTSITNRDAVLASWANGPNDPFVLNGIQLGIFNPGPSSITLTSISIRIQRTLNPQG